MAKFWLVTDENDDLVGCCMTRKAAEAKVLIATAYGRGFIQPITITVNAENMRRMLAQEGGYADVIGRKIEIRTEEE